MEILKKTCCFTGHRTVRAGERAALAARLEQAIIGCIAHGYVNFAAGGALGFDTLAAQAVLRLRQSNPQIRLILVLPCREQSRGWPARDAEEYERIKAAADEIVYTAQEYYRGCMQTRNRYLVDHSSLCICYLTRLSGGTAYTAHYAAQSGLRVINLALERP